jgi:DNA polymerase III delta prime subunit
MDFVGQEKLLKTINGYSWKTMPHTILLLGEEGCGKKTIVRYLASKLNLKLIQVDYSISQDKIIEYQQSALKSLYLIDMTQLRLEKSQNQFLKFIEEPSKNAYIVLINTSEVGILPTVMNRCVKLRFEPYTKEQLRQIKAFDDDNIYKVCRTPGQLACISESSFTEMSKLCESIVLKINSASYANTLSIATKINYKEDYDKFDFSTFLNALEKTTEDLYLKMRDRQALIVYLCINEYRQKLAQNGNISKEAFMTSFLDELWRRTR